MTSTNGGKSLLNHAIAPAAAALLLSAAAAHADVITTVNPGSPLVAPFSSVATSATSTPATETGDGSLTSNTNTLVNVSDLSNNGPGSYTWTNTIAAVPTANTFGKIQGNSYNFVDTYVVDLPAANTSAYAFSLNLSSSIAMSNLSARLYTYSAGGVQNLTIGGTGAPANGTVIGPWSASVNGGTIDSTLLTPPTLSAGEYVLQIIGQETGTSSGTYNATLAVTPVPLPAALPLFLVGLGGFGPFRRRRIAAA